MGIFSRIGDIVNSNINSLLDRAEDPKKMIRLIIQEMEETLVEVRSSTARVIADKKGVIRRLEQLKEGAIQWEEKAKLAINKGREDLARSALLEKQMVDEQITGVDDELVAIDGHLSQLEEEIVQLQKKLTDAKAKQKTLLMREQTVSNRIQVKRQQERDTLDQIFNKFEHFDRRMDRIEGELEAMDMTKPVDLSDEIDQLAHGDKINAELERLKKDMGNH